MHSEEIATKVEPLVCVRLSFCAPPPSDQVKKGRRPGRDLLAYSWRRIRVSDRLETGDSTRNVGCDLVGFHITVPCKYFLETRGIAPRIQINWDQFTVNQGMKRHQAVSISVAFPTLAPGFQQRARSHTRRGRPSYENSDSPFSICGRVDRIDYTKELLNGSGLWNGFSKSTLSTSNALLC